VGDDTRRRRSQTDPQATRSNLRSSDDRTTHVQLLRISEAVTSIQAVAFAARENDGIHVLPLGHSRQDAVTDSADDTRAGDRFDLVVARDRAPVAFHHPFAYAAANSGGAL
jgi:hypothetical protein